MLTLDVTRALEKFRRETGIRDPKIDTYLDPHSLPRRDREVPRNPLDLSFRRDDYEFSMRFKYTTIGIIVPRGPEDWWLRETTCSPRTTAADPGLGYSYSKWWRSSVEPNEEYVDDDWSFAEAVKKQLLIEDERSATKMRGTWRNTSHLAES